ncbi:glycosyltransferase family 4 protein [Dyella sp.]|jgi:glycosyltransferase involved in cell wall biosynthesis|uniref:glycosyltransferase family 4 protein n=1 Tax=Dyella sp. TaxID=1869338 RepID=UPI002D785F72|nr:glycosyltransferase family 4 protein [Dyella sp.]HET6432963.1 glycosyltransferase family 4 protein [Dyella sp.]
MNIIYHHRTRGRDVEGVHIRGIVDALRGLGHRVGIVSFPGADPEQAPAESGAAPKGRSRVGAALARMPGVLFELAELGYNLMTWVRMGKVIRTQKPDMIYERYSLFLFATIWLARRRRIPIVLEVNDSALVERVRPLHMKALARRIERWCMLNCTGLVFISSYFRDQAVAAYGTIAPSVISPNAADIAHFDPARFDRAALRRQRGLEGRVACGFIGSFARWHGVDGFVRAIAPQLHQAPQLTLVLVGDGVTLPEVRALVEQAGLSTQVHLPGRVPHKDIASWVACMDYAVLPDSNHYGSPMKLFEFMAMGVAMVAPDYAPVAEVVDDGATGWLFERRNTQACIDRLLALAGEPEQRERVGRAARDYIVRERQWRNNAEQLLTLAAAGARA